MDKLGFKNLDPKLILALEEKGINKPMPIQSKAVPVLLEHEGDFMASSPTGSGKTLAYAIPILNRLDREAKHTQALILVPNRELCEQITQEFIFMGQYIRQISVEAIYGGSSVKSQSEFKDPNAQIIVATPGRLRDMLAKGILDLSHLDYLVLDEADELILNGFADDMDALLKKAKPTYSTWMFSATLPMELEGFAKKYLKKELKTVSPDKADKDKAKIKHKAILCKAEDKMNVLLHYLSSNEGKKGMIFCRTKSGVQKLYKQLSANKFSSGPIHGDLPQGIRSKIMDQFREGNIDILIATDVASRGMDIEAIDYVLQYHLPDTNESYVHRSGRTSRAGRKGESMLFVFPEEEAKFKELQDNLGVEFEMQGVPEREDQLFMRARLWAKKVAKQKPLLSASERSKELFRKELTHLSKNEILDKMQSWYYSDNVKDQILGSK